MATIKAPKAGCEEVIYVTLTPGVYPIAFKNKVDELMEQKVFNTKKEAEDWVRATPIALEIIYEKHSGLFAVESEAIETDTCSSPYSKTNIICDEE